MITILGQGSFGHAWTLYLDKTLPPTHNIHVWDTRKELVQHLQQHNKHPEFNQKTSQRVKPVQKISSLPKNDVIILAVSSQGVQPVLKQLQPKIQNETTVFNTAKGLSEDGNFFLQTTQEYISTEQYGVIMGATKAEALRRNQFSVATLGHRSKQTSQKYSSLLSSEKLRITPTTQRDSVEIAGVAKNILSLLYGYMIGAQYTDTEREYVFTKIRKEFETNTPALQTKELQPCWDVDVLMSVHSNTRNKEFGIRLGKEPDSTTVETVEGWNSLQKTDENNVLQRITTIKLFFDLLVKKRLTKRQCKKQILP